MISVDTATAIYKCHHEIEMVEKLTANQCEHLKELDKSKSNPTELFERKPSTVTLGVPTGDSSHKILSVPIDVAEAILKKHAENLESELSDLEQSAILEMELES